MSRSFRFVQYLRRTSRKTRLVAGSAGILAGASVGLKWDDWSSKKKGQTQNM